MRDFDMLPGLSKDDEPYVPYALAMAGLSVAVFLTLIDGRLHPMPPVSLSRTACGTRKKPCPEWTAPTMGSNVAFRT